MHDPPDRAKCATEPGWRYRFFKPRDCSLREMAFINGLVFDMRHKCLIRRAGHSDDSQACGKEKEDLRGIATGPERLANRLGELIVREEKGFKRDAVKHIRPAGQPTQATTVPEPPQIRAPPSADVVGREVKQPG